MSEGLKRAVSLLEEAGVFFIATSSEEGARVRPFGVYLEYQNNLYFVTTRDKEVYQQIKKDPRVQIAANLDNSWFRLTGEFVEGDNDSLVAFIEKYPRVKDDKTSVTFKIINAELIEYYSTKEPIVNNF